MKIKQIILASIKKVTAAVNGRQLALATIVAAFCALGFAAVLTPGSGILSAPILARASFADPTDIGFKIVKDTGRRGGRNIEVINAPNARETVMQQIVIAPGGHTGWHSHPGPVVVLIKAGTMSFYSSEDPVCAVRTYTAGQAFVDSGQGHVHIARNESGSENLELWATYFDVPPAGAFRIDAPNPGNCVGF